MATEVGSEEERECGVESSRCGRGNIGRHEDGGEEDMGRRITSLRPTEDVEGDDDGNRWWAV